MQEYSVHSINKSVKLLCGNAASIILLEFELEELEVDLRSLVQYQICIQEFLWLSCLQMIDVNQSLEQLVVIEVRNLLNGKVREQLFVVEWVDAPGGIPFSQ
ncbi:MAG: hypothetical protein IPJ98_03155 [Bryobacterales bacterium]|nr:hypothetical protein [Bryobacterales bacterium]